MAQRHHYTFRFDDAVQSDLQEIAYYIVVSQPLGFPLPTNSDALRYAVTRAASEIRKELAANQGAEGEKP